MLSLQILAAFHHLFDKRIAIENDNYERNFLKGECAHDWIFSFDADEMLVEDPRPMLVKAMQRNKTQMQ